MPAVPGASTVALGSASLMARAVSNANRPYSAALACGFQKPPFGSFQISHRIGLPLKCVTEAAANRANATRASGVRGAPVWYRSLP